MNDTDRCRLLHGPYTPPNLNRGDRATCLYRDGTVVITGWSGGRIPWPRCKRVAVRGGSGLLVIEELARAVRSESSLALQHWFGVGERCVWCWRKALGVRQWGTEGSRRLHAATSAAGADATRARSWTPAERRARSEVATRRGQGRHFRPCPNPGGSRPWSARELALLARLTDEQVATRTGRSANAVRVKRGRATRKR